MTDEFCAERDPPVELCELIANLAPENPFYTAGYVKAMCAVGNEPCALLLRDHGNIHSACLAWIRSGRLSRSLTIESPPTLPQESLFWKELLAFCRANRIWELFIDTYASLAAIPPIPGERVRYKRREYILDLRNTDLRKQLVKGHRNRVNRCLKAGVEVRRTTNTEALREHVQVRMASMGRRRARGEAVSLDDRAVLQEALVANGAAEIFQAVLAGEVLSSLVVLLAEKGAYTHSSGTSPEGMKCGASHFLRHRISQIYQDESKNVLYLGGGDQGEQAGADEYKAGFGGRVVELEAVDSFLAGKLRGSIIRAARYVRSAVR